MGSLVGAVVAGVVGVLLAVGTTVTLVQLNADQKPDPVTKPLIVYGER